MMANGTLRTLTPIRQTPERRHSAWVDYLDAFDWSVNQLEAFQCTATRFQPFDCVTLLANTIIQNKG